MAVRLVGHLSARLVASARKVCTPATMRRTMTKQFKLTMIGPGHSSRLATVTLESKHATWSATSWAVAEWTATARVEHEGSAVEHTTQSCACERTALMAIAEWLRTRFGARTTCLGGTVVIVGVSPVKSEAA